MNLVAKILMRKVKVRAPDWAPDKERFIKLYTAPSMVGCWEYMPRGPYTLVRFLKDDPDHVFAAETHDSLDAAAVSFARLHLPRRGEFCAIIDADHQWVLGWSQTEDASEWSGCEAAFAMLGKHHNQVDVAFWEANAREQVFKETADRAV